MKRMNVIVDQEALAEAMKELGETSASGTINRALVEVSKVMKVRRGFKALSGSGAWEGDLNQMRTSRFADPWDRKADGSTATDTPIPKTKRTKRGSR